MDYVDDKNKNEKYNTRKRRKNELENLEDFDEEQIQDEIKATLNMQDFKELLADDNYDDENLNELLIDDNNEDNVNDNVIDNSITITDEEIPAVVDNNKLNITRRRVKKKKKKVKRKRIS
jgi:hypothetical protein